jgi:integrase
MAKHFTWGEAVEETLRTRPTWRNGSGRKPAMINCGHFTRLQGLSFPCNRITITVLEDIGVELEEEGKSDATINRVTSAVSTVLNHCARRELCNAPPVFTKRKEGEVRLTWFTKDQVEQLVHCAIDPFDRKDVHDICITAAYTGMRQGELLKLKARDIDLGQRQIYVGGRPDVKTKAGNFRAIPIHDRIYDVLCHRMERLSPNVRVFGDEWNDKDQLLRAYKRVRKHARLEESLVFHSLRHSFATWHAEAGTPMRTLMTLMGHKRIETTLRYAKTTDEALTQAMAAI